VRLDANEYNPVEMVGDGKLPNIYWVTASTYFKVLINGCIEWADDLMKENNIEVKLFDPVPFSTFKEAVLYAKADVLGEEPSEEYSNSIVIEDRLSGVVWETSLVAYPRKKWGGWGFEIETYDDTKWTRDHMKELGEVFK